MLKAYTSYQKLEDGSFYVILDLVHSWPDGHDLPGEITEVVLMNVHTEEKRRIPAGDFRSWINKGKLKRVVQE